MTLAQKLQAAFEPMDAAALALFLLLWGGIEAALSSRRFGDRSTAELMGRYRRAWFHVAAERENRIVDATLLTGLRAAVAFYISAVLISIGGAVALIGQADEVQMVATDLIGELSRPRVAWIAKILLVTVALMLALLQFLWAHRVYGYCVIMLGALPEHPEHPEMRAIADKGARMCDLATHSFNRGLRAAYFALSALAWMVGPVAFMAATALTAWVLLRREFLSRTRRVLVGD